MKRLLFWLLLAMPFQSNADICGDPPISASFLQPLASDLQRPFEEWQRLLPETAALGIDTLYLQWSIYQDLDLTRAGGLAFLAQWLDLAHAQGLRVHLGLVADADFGSRIAQPADARAVYLSDLRQRSMAAAQRLEAALGYHPAFVGWYLAEEIDDRNWAEPWQLDLLREHLQALSDDLAELAPERPLSISTYVSGAQPPAEFAKLWRGLWMAAPRLRVLLQDGAGVGAVPRERFSAYAQDFATVAGAGERTWGFVVEMFTQESGPPLDQEPFSASVASIDRIQQQLAVVQALDPAPDEVVAFSVPEYLLDPSRPRQAELLSEYRNLYCN